MRIFEALANRVRYFKEDESGVATMCKMMEDMRQEAIEEDRVKNAKKMLADGLAIEKIAEYSGLTQAEVRDLTRIQSRSLLSY